jgi:predicted nucleic acid-binding protein
VSGNLLDTSVVVGPESGNDPRLASAAISVVTVGELVAGVELARTEELRLLRQARLEAVRAAFEPIPVDDAVVEQYGRLLAIARKARRTTHASDLLIVASASAHGRTLVTRDERQSDLARAAGVGVRVAS